LPALGVEKALELVEEGLLDMAIWTNSAHGSRSRDLVNPANAANQENPTSVPANVRRAAWMEATRPRAQLTAVGRDGTTDTS
jgi:hypothetical protein